MNAIFKFVTFFLVCINVVCAAVFEERALTFEDIHKKIIFQKKEADAGMPEAAGALAHESGFLLDPKSTIIFVDLDGTFLETDKEARKAGTQPLKHADNVRYLKRWLDAGFPVAFLTSRGVEERATTQQNLRSLGVKKEWNIPLLIVGEGVKKGDWLRKNGEFFLDEHITTIIHIDDKKHQLESMKNTVCGSATCYL
ncbi:MAG: hypothetical protein Q8K36_04350, partial [Alphaproteobacteria bacterium]|nr:hypothetical protein [Alphaproteobacteria bacterium]